VKQTAAALALALVPACTHGLFSGMPKPDHDHPVVWIETTGGVEHGVGTSDGVLFLGRTAQEGPCRVHYLLGPTPMVDDGAIEPAGGVFHRAVIDLEVPTAHVLPRAPEPGDDLQAMWLEGSTVRRAAVRPARGEGLEGDLLEWPGIALPAGAGVFTRRGERWALVGVVSGHATLELAGGSRRLIVLAGFERLRDMLATPRKHVRAPEIEYRPDHINVVRDAKR
jgi:hypothetical protein